MDYDINEVLRGLDLMWNNHYTLAEAVFQPHANKIPRFALHYAEVPFFRSFVTADLKDTETTMERLNNARIISEECCKKLKEGSLEEKSKFTSYMDSKIVYGECLYYTAVLQFTRDNKLKGAFNLRKSWKVFESCLKYYDKTDNEELKRCLRFGAGFFYWAISIIPTKFLKIVEFVGFKADKELGMKYIREVHEAGGIRGPHATIVLLSNHLFIPRGIQDVKPFIQEAEIFIQKSFEKFPDAALFYLLASHCARKKQNLKKATEFMIKACETTERNISDGVALIYQNELANCYAMSLEYTKAAEILEKLITYDHFQARSFAALQLASVYSMEKQTEKCKVALQKVGEFVKSQAKPTQVDPILYRQSQRYLSEIGPHFCFFEIMYIRRDLAKLGPTEYQNLLSVLDLIAIEVGCREKKQLQKVNSSWFKFPVGIAKKLSPDEIYYDHRSSYLLIKGAILKGLEKHKEAIECFSEVIEYKECQEKLFIPYCLYELGESYFVIGDFKQAASYMEKSSRYSGYDWEDPLKVRLRVTMDQLEGTGTKIDHNLSDKTISSPAALCNQDKLSREEDMNDEVDF